MSTKAQTLYIDFIIGLIIFGVALLIYYSYNANYQQKDQNDLDVLISNARSISSALVLSGYPDDWNSSNFLRIGIADDQRLNFTKVKRFKQLNYSAAKRNFATFYDYYIHFSDNNDNVLNVNGVCGIGHPEVNSTFSSRTAYLYSSASHSALKSFMAEKLNSDIYFDDIASLAASINNYELILMEYPSLSPAEYLNNRNAIEAFVATGGYLMIAGELTASGSDELAGSTFYKKADQTPLGRNATVIVSYSYSYLPQAPIMFNASYYVENLSTTPSFERVAAFNSNQESAISTWEFGNGNVYFMSDAEGTIGDSNLTPYAEDAAVSFMRGFCTYPNMTNINLKKLVSLNRYLIHNSNAVKMVIYVWL